MANTSPSNTTSTAVRNVGKRLRSRFPRAGGSAAYLLKLARLGFQSDSALRQSGWARTAGVGLPVDRAGVPVPWMNYAVMTFLNERMTSRQSMLEYGGGQSTGYYADRLARVCTVEHDDMWADAVRAIAPSATVFTVDGDDPTSYVSAADAEGPFDIVLVDGIHRNECLRGAPHRLTEQGVLILDDVERSDYQEAVRELQDQGFKVLTFTSIKPSDISMCSTAIIYRTMNVFNL